MTVQQAGRTIAVAALGVALAGCGVMGADERTAPPPAAAPADPGAAGDPGADGAQAPEAGAPQVAAPEAAAPAAPDAAAPDAAAPAPADEVLTRDQVEALVIDRVSEEAGIPRFLVSGYIENNGGFEGIAREYGVSEDQLALLDQGVTRGQVEEYLAPVLAELRTRLGG